LAAYPFSPSKRVELSGGWRRISFDAEQQTLVTDAITGQILVDETQKLPAPSALNIGQVGAALVGDASIYGIASPILGERYRLEATPAIGTLNLTNVLADYRRYVMPVRPYTVAFRALHYARYGSGAEDERLLPLFLGYPNLVRGYETNSFSSAECVPDATSDCPQYDRLLGSRVLVGNVELRFPIYGIFHRERSFYGPIPVEGLVFADGGVAWNSGEKPSFFGGDRRPVSSTGLGLRVNALGFAILELDFVKPWDRPVEGWHWQFNLISGF
jgi:outer membrane protein assembly factor BamA